jgi:hypothetical protein
MTQYKGICGSDSGRAALGGTTLKSIGINEATDKPGGCRSRLIRQWMRDRSSAVVSWSGNSANYQHQPAQDAPLVHWWVLPSLPI